MVAIGMIPSASNDFFIESIDDIPGAIRGAPIYYIVRLLFIYVEREIDISDFKVKVFSEIIRNAQFLTIQDYISVWTILGKLKLDVTDPSRARLEAELIKVSIEGKYFKPHEMYTDELTNLLIGLASNRIQDFSFLRKFMDQIKLRLKNDSITLEELGRLAPALYAYSKSYENIFIRFHDVCESKFGQF